MIMNNNVITIITLITYLITLDTTRLTLFLSLAVLMRLSVHDFPSHSITKLSLNLFQFNRVFSPLNH